MESVEDTNETAESVPRKLGPNKTWTFCPLCVVNFDFWYYFASVKRKKGSRKIRFS